jgi:predicted molibdopterin-dependent oxidoreductase YjgC
VAGLATTFGSGAMTNSMDDIVEHARAIFIIGSNTTENHPVFGTKIRQAVLKRDVQLVVADPRKIDITEFATEHIRHNPGSDIALVNGLMYIILEKGWQDEAFIQARTENFEDFRESILSYPPEKVSDITGVSVEQLYRVAEILGTQKPMAVIWAMGITQHTVGTSNVMTLANLQMLLGNIGIPGGGANPLRGQNNVQGACDLGGLPNVFPGYQSVTDPVVREKFEKAWGIALSSKVGMTITELMPAAFEGRVKALYVVAENPVMSDPDTNHIRRCLEELDFMVLQEIFPTESASYADVLLPGVTFAEKTGTFTSTERRLQMVNQAIEPLQGARPDLDIIPEIARRVIEYSSRKPTRTEYSGWDYQGPEHVMQEIAALTPIYAGASHERLRSGERLQWPILGPDHPGTPILHVGKFSRGKGRFMPTDHVPPVETPDKEYPLLLSTGRVLYHWHGGEMTRRSKGLLEVYDRPLIEVNPEDAERLEIGEEAVVRVTSRRGVIEAEAWITDRVPPGVIFSNFHFPHASANTLTIAALDPVAKIPEYKACAVKVEAV